MEGAIHIRTFGPSDARCYQQSSLEKFGHRDERERGRERKLLPIRNRENIFQNSCRKESAASCAGNIISDGVEARRTALKRRGEILFETFFSFHVVRPSAHSEIGKPVGAAFSKCENWLRC